MSRSDLNTTKYPKPYQKILDHPTLFLLISNTPKPCILSNDTKNLKDHLKDAYLASHSMNIKTLIYYN